MRAALFIFGAGFFLLGLLWGRYYQNANTERVMSNFFIGLSPECRYVLGDRLNQFESIVNNRRKKAGLGTVEEMERGQ